LLAVTDVVVARSMKVNNMSMTDLISENVPWLEITMADPGSVYGTGFANVR
jgi:hypothetical protein